MNKVIQYIISAKDATAGAISSALNRVKSFAGGVGRNLMNIKAGFEMLGSAAQNLLGVMRKAFAFETMTTQFKTLIGDMDSAREHMAMLQKLGDTPPFSLEEFAKASRSLMVMTDGALGFEKSLNLVGDAAAATGQPIENLAREIGRAYGIIRDGQPIKEAVTGLRNMGAITPEVVAKLEDLQKTGASNAECWKMLEDALGKFKGAMEETEQTGDGLMGAIGAQWDDAVRSFGAAFLDTAKEGLGLLLAKIKQLNEDGTIAVWADRAGQALKGVIEWAKDAFGWLGKLVDGYKWVRDGLEKVGAAAGAYAGTLIGGGTFEDASNAAGEAYAQTERGQEEERKETAEREEKVRSEAVKKRAKSEADASKKKLDEEKKIQEQLAAAQAKQDAKKAADAKAAAEKEAAEKAKMDAELREKEAAERKRIEEKIHAERVRLMQAELSQREKEQSDAQTRLAAAQSKVAQAWGWYRDKDSMAAQLEEEKANAEAEKQFEKDFSKLKFRRDWRTATNLSVDEEAVRRVGLAREEEAAAQKYVEETAANTARAADSLEKIETIFTEGGV